MSAGALPLAGIFQKLTCWSASPLYQTLAWSLLQSAASHSHLTLCHCSQAHFSPGGAALGAPLQSSLQTVDPQIAAAAAAAAARYNPQVQQAWLTQHNLAVDVSM